MHELSIAQAVVSQVLAEIDRRKLARVSAIGLRIGELTDIQIDALRFGFEVATADTTLKGCELKIEKLPIIGRCRDCGTENRMERYLFRCPACQSYGIDIKQGMELAIAYLEAEGGN